MGSDIEDPDHARTRPGNRARDGVPRHSPEADPRSWCLAAVARLERGRPEAALEAARQAIERDPGGEWAHRLASLALERLGRDPEAVAAAREAVRLAPGSWAARLRLGGALRRMPDGWREAWAEARKAVSFAPEEPDPHVLAGDLALLRGDHESAVASYRAALRRSRDHPAARVNLGLALLRWERPRNHHDPAWDADPRDTARARRAAEVWSRQVRVMLAVATVAVTAAALGLGLHKEAQIGGALALGGVVAVTIRQTGRVPVWPRVPAMLRRDLWLTMDAAMAVAAVGAYVAGLATLPGDLDGARDGVWAGACGIVLLNGVAAGGLRLLVEAWQGRPVRALVQFAAASPVPAARRDAGVTFWIIAGRAWWGLVLLLSLCLLTAQPRLALAAAAAPVAVVLAVRRGRAAPMLRAALRDDRPLALSFALLAVASLALALAGAAPG
uniref:tetratricopeptide repeat protein n=1 Tax=Microtetraspora niveoalba TaxID=46175 RepID=UPI0008307B28